MERHREGYELTGRSLNFKPPSAVQKFWTTWKLLRARPWRRFQKGSVLIMKASFLLWMYPVCSHHCFAATELALTALQLGGEIGDTPAGQSDESSYIVVLPAPAILTMFSCRPF